MTWDDFGNQATQLGVLVALTGLIYRLFRLWWPDVPEAVVQVIATILSTAASLVTTWQPGVPLHRWITLGLAVGVLQSGQIIKLLDWSAAAMTKTGAPQLGVPERPPAWFAAALAQGATVQTPEPMKPQSPAALRAQMKANDAAVEKVKQTAGPGKPEGWE